MNTARKVVATLFILAVRHFLMRESFLLPALFFISKQTFPVLSYLHFLTHKKFNFKNRVKKIFPCLQKTK